MYQLIFSIFFIKLRGFLLFLSDKKTPETIITNIISQISQSLQANMKPPLEVYYREKSRQNKADLEK